MLKRLGLVALALAAASGPAFAHLDPGEHGSFAAGFTHPLFGLDHILAMLAVGLWAGSAGGRTLWLLPSAFLGAMALGFGLALTGLELPAVEPAILASVIVIGALVALALAMPPAAGMLIVGAFGLFHGNAHGIEIGAATLLAYGSGFIAATALLHALGAGLALLLWRGRVGMTVLRGLGALTSLGGIWLAMAG